jgi:plastocyanin
MVSKTLFFGVLALLASASVSATEYEVRQQNKLFSVKSLNINVGDTVNFANDDSFFHNVFSLSDAKIFDLGGYPKGQSRKVNFNRAGIVEVECALHPGMKMTIEVNK